jgi:cbb3-type cytochrome oxidase cytochrome c subunit
MTPPDFPRPVGPDPSRVGGPDLSRVGDIHTDPEWYRKYLQDPRSVFPESVAPPLRVPKEDLDDVIAYLLTLRKLR